MQRFKSPDHAQDFLSAHAFIHEHFHPRRHLLTANSYRAIRTEAFRIWKQETINRRSVRGLLIASRCVGQYVWRSVVVVSVVLAGAT
jgi:hypothetical protein